MSMPDYDPYVGALAQGIMDTGASTYNTEATIAANKELAEYAYTKDLEMWNRANEYNSPVSQMQRIQAAGLNKNLVYGTGVTGNTATQTPKYQAPNVQYDIHPRLGLTEAISAYQDYQLKKQQVSNMQAQNANIIATTLTEGIKQASIAQNTARSKFDLDLAQELKNYQLEAAKLNVRKMYADIQNLSATSKLRLKESTLRDYDIDDRKAGIRPHDPYVVRGLNRFFREPNKAVDSMLETLDRTFNPSKYR